jgi:hypothetical protein
MFYPLNTGDTIKTGLLERESAIQIDPEKGQVVLLDNFWKEVSTDYRETTIPEVLA